MKNVVREEGSSEQLWLSVGPVVMGEGEGYLSQLVAQLGGEDVGEGHELRGLVGGIAEHVALVTSTSLLEGLCAQSMDTLANIGRLLLDVHQHLRQTTP